MMTQLTDLSTKKDGHAHLKKALLNEYKMIIFQSLKPQMGGFIDVDSIGISILKSELKSKNHVLIKCSVFYIERIGGCNCLDEPHAENGYCEKTFQWTDSGLSIFTDSV